MSLPLNERFKTDNLITEKTGRIPDNTDNNMGLQILFLVSVIISHTKSQWMATKIYGHKPLNTHTILPCYTQK